MKTRLTILKLTILLFCAFATTAAFGQTLIWTNALMGSPFGNEIGISTNWSGPAGPGLNSPVSGTTIEFNGTVPGPMVLYKDVVSIDNNGALGPVGGGPGSSGTSIYINAAQTSPVTISGRVSPQGGNMGLNAITVDSGAGQLTLGDTSQNSVLCTGRPGGGTHDWINNSVNPVIICPNMQWQNGAGAAFTLEFDSPSATPGSGLGDFGITNSLRSSNSGQISLWFVSSGTITWTYYSIPNDAVSASSTIGSPMFLNACTTLILKTNNPSINTVAIQNNNDFGFPPSPLIYDGGANNVQTLSGVIGGGTSPKISISVWSGTLSLSGANLFTGDVTNKGGELIANRGVVAGVSDPLGLGNLIHLNGGTLGWSLNNSFDYSSRFATTPDPIYNFDSGGATVTLATGLGGATSTLTKSGNGTISLAGTSSYGGATTITGGKLEFVGTKTGTGNVSVSDGAAVDFFNTGTAATPGTLALGSVSGPVTLEFNNVSSTVNTIVTAGTVTSPAGGNVLINIESGTFTVGQTYPLFKWTTGTPPATSLGTLPGYVGNIVTNISGKEIDLVVTDTAYTWSGINNNSWDTTTANNWQKNGVAVVFANGFQTLLNDTANSVTPGQLNITNLGVVTPLTLTIVNNTNAYQITSSGAGNIGGATGLNKSGTNSLSLNGGTNTYTGVTTISGGAVIVSALANGGTPSDIGASSSNAVNLVFDGGTLQYTNNTVNIDRLFTITGNGATIDASGVGPLQLTNTGSIIANGAGPRNLILTGTAATNNVMAPVIADSTGGATSLVKNGAGEWDLLGNNTYSGVTTVNNGLLRVGEVVGPSASGSLGTGGANLAGGTTLMFSRTNSLTQGGAINGGGALTVASGTVTLTGNSGYTGGTSVSNGATLNIGNGGANANLAAGSPVLNNGFMKFNSTTPITIRGFAANITGTGNFEIAGTGLVAFEGAKLYTGWTLIDAGARLQVSVGNETTGMGGANITNNGSIYMQRQDNGVFIITNNIVGSGNVEKDTQNSNPGDITLYGTNTYTGGTIIGTGAIILGDGVTPGSGAIVGNVVFTNSRAGFDNFRELEFNRPDSFTFPGIISGTNAGAAGNRGRVFQNGFGVLTLTGNNTYVDGTIVSNGVLVVGNGGTTGSIGNGTLDVSTTLVFNRSDSLTFSGGINGTGTVAQAGSGILTLSGSLAGLWNTNDTTDLFVAGSLAVSNGTVVVTGGRVGGNLNVSGGLLSPSDIGTVGSLALTNAVTNTSMTISSGGVLITVNKSLAPSNSVIVAAIGNVVATGGTVKLVNYGPAFAPGDKFIIFRQLDGITPLAVSGGATMAVSAPGVTSFINHLDSDGSVTVSGVVPPGTEQITPSVSGRNLNLSWPASWTGVHLQSQTNTLAKGLGTNWVTILGSDASNSYIAPMVNTNVFYRLAP